MFDILWPLAIAFGVSLLVGPLVIKVLRRVKFGQVVRDDGPQTHLKKSGTPTMGGFIIIIASLITMIFFIKELSPNVIVGLFAFLGFGLIGFLDDYIKVVKRNSKGLRAWQKSILQLVFASVIAVYCYMHIGSDILVPFTKTSIDLGYFYIPIIIFIIIGVDNSTNLTDGVDGLLGGVSVIIFATFGVLILASGITGFEDMFVLAAVVTGALLGYLKFNVHPAKVFMGDTGSLAIGGIMVYLALVTKTVLWLPIIGACLMASAVSVIIQVGYYKKTKKRVFKMAPLHHHFELLGYSETKIVSMYMLVTAGLCILGLLAYRL